MRPCLMICIYYLFMFKGTDVAEWSCSISHLHAADVTVLCFSRVCFQMLGNTHIMNVSNPAYFPEHSKPKRWVRWVVLTLPPSLPQSSDCFFVFFIKSTFKTESNFVLMTVWVFFFFLWIDFVFVFITRPVNISNLRITHTVLSLGVSVFKLVTHHPVIPMGSSIKKYLRDSESLTDEASGLLFVTTQSVVLFFFNSLLGSRRRCLAIFFTYLFLL